MRPIVAIASTLISSGGFLFTARGTTRGNELSVLINLVNYLDMTYRW